MEHFDSISETQLTNNQEPLVNTKTSKTKYAIQREKALTKLQNRFQQNRPLFLYVRDTMKNLLNDPTRVKLLFFTNLIANKIGKRVDRQAKMVSIQISVGFVKIGCICSHLFLNVQLRPIDSLLKT